MSTTKPLPEGECGARMTAHLQLSILRECGVRVPPRARVLDFGCGNGSVVQAFLQMGFDASGCDLNFKQGRHTRSLKADGRIRLINMSRYQLPFEDASFDFLVSSQVMEHVQDYETAIAEMRRVLKPSGACVHLFPSRWIPIEPHVFVPFATVARQKYWLALWAALQVRKPSQKGKCWQDVVCENKTYLDHCTNYLSGATIRASFSKQFDRVLFAEEAFLRHSPNTRGRRLHVWARRYPLLFGLYRTFWARVVVAFQTQTVLLDKSRIAQGSP